MTNTDTVFIFEAWQAVPRYHDYGRIRDDADVTKCGLVMYDTKVRYSASLRRDHADRFAKPCAKCFREDSA